MSARSNGDGLKQQKSLLRWLAFRSLHVEYFNLDVVAHRGTCTQPILEEKAILPNMEGRQ